MTSTPPNVKVRQRRPLNRVGKSFDPASSPPETLGQRMAARRLELGLTQAQVAKQVRFKTKTGRRKDAESVLTRNAYCMYEIDGAEPDLQKIVGIAKALQVSPGWLAFGEQADPESHSKRRHGIAVDVSRALRDASDTGTAPSVPLVITISVGADK